MASELFGRDSEIGAVELLLARIGDGGGSLLVLGDPGIGKSALAEVATRRAADRGMRVLACAGVPGEAHLSFAGLHQLLRPLLAEADALPGAQRDALLTALGVGDGVAPAMPLVGLAALELLAAGAGRAPVLVVAEDVHWLDSSTCEVLAFVSRRLGADPVGLVGTAREAELGDNPLAGAGLAELRLGPLDAAAASAVLDARAVLDPVARERVLEEAAGNPLAGPGGAADNGQSRPWRRGGEWVDSADPAAGAGVRVPVAGPACRDLHCVVGGGPERRGCAAGGASGGELGGGTGRGGRAAGAVPASAGAVGGARGGRAGPAAGHAPGAGGGARGRAGPPGVAPGGGQRGAG
jgi:hypothetical protein